MGSTKPQLSYQNLPVFVLVLLVSVTVIATTTTTTTTTVRNNNHTTAAPLLSESNHELCGATTDTGSCGCGNDNNIDTRKQSPLVAASTLHSISARMTHKPITHSKPTAGADDNRADDSQQLLLLACGRSKFVVRKTIQKARNRDQQQCRCIRMKLLSLAEFRR